MIPIPITTSEKHIGRETSTEQNVHRDLELYSRIYDLPVIEYEERVKREFLEHYSKNNSFVTVSIGNSDGEVLFLRDFNRNHGWELPGGYIEEDEDIRDSVVRIVRNEAGAKIDELEPLTLVKNKFWAPGESITHYGIAFTAMIRGWKPKSKKNIQKLFSKKIPHNLAYQDEKIVEMSRPAIEQKSQTLPEEEIDSGRKHRVQHIFHKHLINPALGRKSSRNLKDKIIELVDGSPDRILDAACGDDELVFDVNERYSPNICIANDISWETLSLLKQKERSSGITFTNHNVLEIPIDMEFDLTIFKNTLHHIPREHQKELLVELDSISEQLIVMDINNPQEHSLKSELWNLYYRKFLGDEGGDFLTYPEFQKLAGEIPSETRTGTLSTLKGEYMYFTT